MIIERFDLIAYGRFTKYSIDLSAGPRRFHIIYGPNESGKSTSLRALSDWLFGFAGTTSDDYMHKSSALRVGGRVSDPESGKFLECIRRKGNKDTLLASDNKTRITSEILDEMLQKIDKQTFLSQFGISHQQLVEGGESILSGEGDLSEILFSAGAGLGQLKTVRQQLSVEAKAIFSDRRSASSRMYSLLDEWEQLKSELQNRSLPPTRYLTVKRDLENVKDNAAKSSATLNQRRSQLGRLKAIKQAMPLFIERQILLERQQLFSDVTPLADDFSARREGHQNSLSAADQQIKIHQSIIDQTDEQLALISVDEIWLDHEAEIERLGRNVTQFEQSIKTIQDKQRQLTQCKSRIEELRQSLGNFGDNDELDVQCLSASQRDEVVALANQFSGVTQRANDSAEKLLTARSLAKNLKSQLKGLPRPLSTSQLEETLRSIGQPQQLFADRDKARAKFDESQAIMNTRLRRLIGFRGTLEQAINLIPPSESVLAKATSEIQSLQQKIHVIVESIKKNKEEQSTTRTRLEQSRTDLPLPDSMSFESLKAARDRNLDALIEHVSRGAPMQVKQAIELRDQVIEIDRIYALRHEHHEQVLRRENDERSLDVLETQHESLQAAHHDLTQSLANAVIQWKEVWNEVGVEASDLEEMRSWETAHAQVIEAAQDHRRSTEELRQADARIDQAVQSLQGVIQACSMPSNREALMPVNTAKTSKASGATLFDELDDVEPYGDSVDNEPETISMPWTNLSTADLSLSTCYAFASQLREDMTTARRQYDNLVTQLEAADRDLAMAQSAAESAKEKLIAWQSRWDLATGPLKVVGTVVPSAIDVILKTIDELARLQRDVYSHENDLSQLQSDGESYRESVLKVVQACAPDRLETDSRLDEINLVLWLQTELKKQRENDGAKKILLSRRRDAISNAAQQRTIRDLRLAELMLMCKEANCDSVDKLRLCEQRSSDKRACDEKLMAKENEIRLLAEGDSTEAFEGEAANYEAALIDDQISTLELQISDLEAEQAQSQQEVGRLNAEMQKMDGSDDAAELLQRQQSLLSKLRRESEQFAKLTIAQEVLSRAIEHYRQQNEGTVLERAGRYFADLTCNQYKSLQVEFDSNERPRLFAVKADQSSVPAERLSDGTADGLYLAMRIASLEVHLTNHRPIPLVIDDCLIQFDDKRAGAALQVLSDLSERNQVIMFTHHQHILELAQEHLPSNHFHLHELQA